MTKHKTGTREEWLAGPLELLKAEKEHTRHRHELARRRMGWTFPWASSFSGDFNFDFSVSFTEQQQRTGSVDYNYRSMNVTPVLQAGGKGPVAELGAMTGTDAATYLRELPGISAFVLE